MKISIKNSCLVWWLSLGALVAMCSCDPIIEVTQQDDPVETPEETETPDNTEEPNEPDEPQDPDAPIDPVTPKVDNSIEPWSGRAYRGTALCLQHPRRPHSVGRGPSSLRP